VKTIQNILVGIFSVVALVFGLIFYSFSRTIPLKDRQQLSGGAVQEGRHGFCWTHPFGGRPGDAG